LPVARVLQHLNALTAELNETFHQRWTQAYRLRLEAASGAAPPNRAEGTKVVSCGLVVMATSSEESPRQVPLCGKMLLRNGHWNQQSNRQFKQHLNQQITIRIWA